MRKLSILLAAGLTIVLCLSVVPVADAAPLTSVDLELQLLVDVSGSIDSREFDQQKKGYAAAFKDQSIMDAILDTSGGRTGAIAVQLVYWSGVGEQQVALDWQIIDSELRSTYFGNQIGVTTRPGMTQGWSGKGQTAPGSAIRFGASQFDNDYDGARNVIDVSGDGAQNDPPDDPTNTADARDAALAGGIDTVNGLVILNDRTDPLALSFYQSDVIGGTGAFLVTAGDFSVFGEAVTKKLLREIQGSGSIPGGHMPEPASALLFGAGALVVGGFVRRKSTRQ